MEGGTIVENVGLSLRSLLGSDEVDGPDEGSIAAFDGYKGGRSG